MKTDAAALISPLIEDFHQLSYIIDQLKQESFGGPDAWLSEIKRATELRDKAVELIRREGDPELTGARVKVAVIGDFNAGKSSFINSLLGEALCPVQARPTTSSITTFKYGDTEAIYLLKSAADGNDTGPARRLIERDEYVRKVCHEGSKGQRYEFEVYYPFSGFRDIELYDTPGFGNAQNSDDERITLEKCEAADAILFIFDINRGNLGADMRRRLDNIKRHNPGLRIFAILNKIDQKSNPDIVQELHEAWCDEKIFDEVITYSAKIEITKFQESTTDTQGFIDRLKFSTTYWKVRHERGTIHFKPILIAPSKERKFITEILSGIQSKKYAIIKNNQLKDSSKYLRNCKKFISNLIKSAAEKEKLLKENNINLKDNLNDKIIFDDLDVVSAVKQSISESLECRKLSREERSYIFTPYLKSNFNSQLFLSSIRKSHVSYLIKKSLSDFIKEIPGEVFEEFKEKIFLIKNIAQHPEEIFTPISAEFKNSLSGKIFEEEEDFIKIKRECHLEAAKMTREILHSRIYTEIIFINKIIKDYKIYTKGSTEARQIFTADLIKKLHEFQEKLEFRFATKANKKDI